MTSLAPAAPTREGSRSTRAVARYGTFVILAFILLAAFSLRLHNLGQPGMKDLDEAFHAIVARSMIDEPLRPTLYAHAYLPADYRDWHASQVWLHKPPVALWQMAASMGVLGESNWTMRLPSLLLSTAAVALTFLIGRALGDDRAGLIAAFLQAMSPPITRLVHGQVFADHVDIAMLFYCELAVLLLLRAATTGSTRYAAIAGAFVGVAWLTKSFPALFVVGLALSLWLGARFVDQTTRFRLAGRQVATLAGAMIAACLPWTLWCVYAYPREFLFEQIYVFRHLGEDIEQFAAPWDRLAFDYLARAFFEWYPLALVGLALAFVDAARRRDGRRGFVSLWAVGVIVPHMLATSKTPSATLTGWPAMWLGIGLVVADATRGRLAAAAAVVVGAILITPRFPTFATVLPKDYTAASIMFAQWRLLLQVGAMVLAGAAVARFVPRPPARSAAFAVSLVVIGVLIWPAARHARLAARTAADVMQPVLAFPKLGAIVREHAPPEAVFLVDNAARNEHVLAMWWLDRECYALRGDRFPSDVTTILSRGGTPFVLSRREWPGVPLFTVAGEGTVYRLDRPR